MPRPCRCAQPSRLSDHAGTGLRSVPRPLDAPGERRKSRPNSAAPCPTIFMCSCRTSCSGRSKPIWKPCRTFTQPSTRSPRLSASRRADRTSACSVTPRSHRSLRSICAEYLFGLAGRQRQARARSVSVCRRADERRAGTLPRDRGQRRRHHRRHAAGMTVLGFHGGSHCRPGYGEGLRAAGATATFDDMRQLPGLIERIGAAANGVIEASLVPHCCVIAGMTPTLDFRPL